MRTESITARKMTVESFFVLAVFYGIIFFVSYHYDILDERSLLRGTRHKLSEMSDIFFSTSPCTPSGTVTSGIETIFDTAKATESHKFGVRSEF